jgi:hypothetical protein
VSIGNDEIRVGEKFPWNSSPVDSSEWLRIIIRNTLTNSTQAEYHDLGERDLSAKFEGISSNTLRTSRDNHLGVGVIILDSVLQRNGELLSIKILNPYNHTGESRYPDVLIINDILSRAKRNEILTCFDRLSMTLRQAQGERNKSGSSG